MTPEDLGKYDCIKAKESNKRKDQIPNLFDALVKTK